MPRRPFLRFGLRGLLVLLTVSCVCLALHFNRLRRERLAIQWALDSGGGFGADDPNGPMGGVPVDRPSGWRAVFIGNNLPPRPVVSLYSVDDLSPLTGLPSLTRLLILDSTVGDLAPVGRFESLEVLAIFGGSPVRDVAPLAGLASLEILVLQDTMVGDLSPLAGLSSLRTLNLEGTRGVHDLAPLTELVSLEALNVSGTEVSDLSPLAGLTSLETLLLSGTEVSDLSPLAGLTSLETLHLYGTKVRDLSPLVEIKSLTSLDLVGVPVEEGQIRSLEEALPKLHVMPSGRTDTR